MTKGRHFSIYCIILFLYAEVRKNNHILLQRGIYLSQKWRQTSLLAFQKPSDGYPISSVTLSGVITITSPNLQKHKSERIYKKYAFGFFSMVHNLRPVPARRMQALARHMSQPRRGWYSPLFRPIRPWRDLRSKNGPLHRFARRHAGRHIRIMGKGMKVRAVSILPATAKNEKIAANGKLAAGKLKTF